VRSVTNRGWGSTYRVGSLMSQLIASIPGTLEAFRGGRVTSYRDIIDLSR
jgi:hypothetical protein